MTSWIDSTDSFQLPAGWHEVRVGQYAGLLACRTVEERASYFAGRPIQVNGLIADALSWLFTDPAVEGGLPYPQNLGQETYLQVELLRKVVNSKQADWLPQVYGLFTARSLSPTGTFNQQYANHRATQCLQWSMEEVFPAVHHCLQELQRLGEKYKELGVECTCESCAAAKAAGLHELQALSFFNTLDALAEKMGTTIDAVGQMPYDTVALMLLRATRQHAHQARVHQQSKQS